MEKPNPSPFRWAVIGSAGVARQFAHGLVTVDGAGSVARLAARDPGRTEQVAKAIGAPAWSTDYTDCFGADVDAVYIAAPLGQHEAIAVAALKAGKPTLVEKPFALDAQAARRIMAAAEETNTFCMEAMWPRFLPVYRDLKTRIEAGELGEMRQFTATFSGAVEMDAGFGVFDGAQRGGALMHRACYGVSLARYLLGPITDVKATGRVLDQGADAHVGLLLSHGGTATSMVGASYETQIRDQVSIAGTRASVMLQPSLYRPTQTRLSSTHVNTSHRSPGSREALKAGVAWNWMRDQLDGLRRFRSRGTRLRHELRGFGYGYQAAELVRCVTAGASNSPLMPLAESVEIAEHLDAAYAQLHQGMDI